MDFPCPINHQPQITLLDKLPSPCNTIGKSEKIRLRTRTFLDCGLGNVSIILASDSLPTGFSSH